MNAAEKRILTHDHHALGKTSTLKQAGREDMIEARRGLWTEAQAHIED